MLPTCLLRTHLSKNGELTPPIHVYFDRKNDDQQYNLGISNGFRCFPIQNHWTCQLVNFLQEMVFAGPDARDIWVCPKMGCFCNPAVYHDFLGLSEDIEKNWNIKTLPICVCLRKKGTPIPSHDQNLIFAIQLPSLVGKSWYKSSIFRQTIEIWYRGPPWPGMTWVHLGNSPWWLLQKS